MPASPTSPVPATFSLTAGFSGIGEYAAALAAGLAAPLATDAAGLALAEATAETAGLLAEADAGAVLSADGPGVAVPPQAARANPAASRPAQARPRSRPGSSHIAQARTAKHAQLRTSHDQLLATNYPTWAAWNPIGLPCGGRAAALGPRSWDP